MKRFARLMMSLLAVVALGTSFLLLGMRRKNPTVVNAVRKLNKAVMNPKQMETAGTPGAYAAIIEHTGRKSGKAYRTPIGVSPTEGGFLTMLPYGRGADWLQNVLAAGSATIVYEGETYHVDRPELVPLAAAPLDAKDRRTARLFGVSDCLVVHTISA